MCDATLYLYAAFGPCVLYSLLPSVSYANHPPPSRSCGATCCLTSWPSSLPRHSETHTPSATLNPPPLIHTPPCSMELWRDLLLDFMAEFAGGKPTVLVGNSIGALACLMVRVLGGGGGGACIKVCVEVCRDMLASPRCWWATASGHWPASWYVY